jgi:hypothetical protein
MLSSKAVPGFRKGYKLEPIRLKFSPLLLLLRIRNCRSLTSSCKLEDAERFLFFLRGGGLFSFALPMLQWIRAIPLDCLESCETCVCLCVSFHKNKKQPKFLV